VQMMIPAPHVGRPRLEDDEDARATWDEAKALREYEAATDPYGSAVMRFAEQWARIMESRIAAASSAVDATLSSSSWWVSRPSPACSSPLLLPPLRAHSFSSSASALKAAR
jgi:hypothetical protein